MVAFQLPAAAKASRNKHWRLPGLTKAALSFWVFTYILLSFRANLLFPGGPLVSGSRMVITATGGVLLWLALERLTAAREQSALRRLRAAVALISVAGLALFAFRFVVLAFGDDPAAMDIASNTRWSLVWTGYFSAWIFAYLAFCAPGEAFSPLVLKGMPPGPQVPEQVSPPAEAAYWVDRGGQMLRVARKSIQWIQAEGNYVRIYSEEGVGLLRASLGSMIAELEAEGFVQLHRSAICRISAIQMLKRRQKRGLLVVLTTGAEIPVGRRYAPVIQNLCAH